MHKFSVEDIASEDFDLNLLKLIEQDISEIGELYRKVENNIWSKYGEKSKEDNIRIPYLLVLDTFLDTLKVSEIQIVSIGFLEENILAIVKEFKRNEYEILNWIINNIFIVCSRYDFLANKFLLKAPTISCYFLAKSIFNSGHLSIDNRINFLLNAELELIDKFFSYNDIGSLDLLNPEQSKRFLNSSLPGVRLEIYKKLGISEYINKMLKEKHTETRRLAACYLKIGDERFSYFLNERTKTILEIVLTRCPEHMLPMFFGNNMIKKDSVLAKMLNTRIAK